MLHRQAGSSTSVTCCSLPPAFYLPAHWTLPTAYCPQLLTLEYRISTLHPASCSPLTTLCPLFSTPYNRISNTAFYLPAHRTLPTAYCLLPSTLCSPFSTIEYPIPLPSFGLSYKTVRLRYKLHQVEYNHSRHDRLITRASLHLSHHP